MRAGRAGCGCFGNLVQRTPAEAFWQDLLLLVPPLLLAFGWRDARAARAAARTAAAALGAAGAACSSPGARRSCRSTTWRRG